MPDQSEAATEHALIQEITAPLASLPDDPVPIAADTDFPIVLRGYDRLAVDAYVKRTSQLVAELQATRSPEAAVRRALERVGEQISGILQRAHDTAQMITTQSRSEAEDRMEIARQEADHITHAAETRVKELDAETDRIWAERQRIVEDAQALATQLLGLAEEASKRFPAADGGTEVAAGEEDLVTTDEVFSAPAASPGEASSDPDDDMTTFLPLEDLEDTRDLAAEDLPQADPPAGEAPGEPV
jgi:hypothetical protein